MGAIHWAKMLDSRGMSWVMVSIPEAQVDALFDESMALLASGKISNRMKIWVRFLAECLVEDYYSAHFQNLRIR